MIKILFICHLDIQPVSPIFTNEVDLLIACLADSNGIAPAQKLHIDDIFQNQVNILQIAAEYSLPSGTIAIISRICRIFNNIG